MDKKKRYLEGEGEEFVHGHCGGGMSYPMQSIEELCVTGRLDEHGRVWVKGILSMRQLWTVSGMWEAVIPFLCMQKKAEKERRFFLVLSLRLIFEPPPRRTLFRCDRGIIMEQPVITGKNAARSSRNGDLREDNCEVLSAYDKSYFMDADHSARVYAAASFAIQGDRLGVFEASGNTASYTSDH